MIGGTEIKKLLLELIGDSPIRLVQLDFGDIGNVIKCGSVW